jgi:hypothetical protein
VSSRTSSRRWEKSGGSVPSPDEVGYASAAAREAGVQADATHGANTLVGSRDAHRRRSAAMEVHTSPGGQKRRLCARAAIGAAGSDRCEHGGEIRAA